MKRVMQHHAHWEGNALLATSRGQTGFFANTTTCTTIE